MYCTDICCPLVLGNGTVSCEMMEVLMLEITFCCHGFIMDGSDSRTCTEVGMWSGEETTCTAHM